MQPYQKRILDEAKDLGVRLEKLIEFNRSDTFKELPEADRVLLLSQRDFMRGYLNTLNQRIARFTS